MKKLLVVILLFFCVHETFAQTSLGRGDVAFVGLNTTGTAEFSFVFLVDVESNTSIGFSDEAWTNSFGGGFVNHAGDGRFTWTTANALAAGTIVKITPSTASADTGTISGAGFTLAGTGDQIFAYQGTHTSPDFIAGLNYNVDTYTNSNSDWNSSSSSARTSHLPSDLTAGQSAVFLYEGTFSARRNFRYACGTTSGTSLQLRTAIFNRSNWEYDNFTAYQLTPFPCSFTITSSCSEPDIPTLSESTTNVCAGSDVTITITGNLHDALAWYIYSGGCGTGQAGTLVDTTSSNTIVVTPTQNTYYHVRGEGNCVTPASCAITSLITTITSHDSTNTATVCSGGSYTFADGTVQNNITSTVTYTSTFTNMYNCDSTITTTVNVNPTYNMNDTVDLCTGGDYTFPDGTTQNNITSDVDYTSNMTTVAGCDSIIKTVIQVQSEYNETETVAVCSGGSYTFPDGTVQNNITSTATHTSTLNSVFGCDSIVVTTVNVNPVYNQSETVSVCSGASHTFPDGTTQNNITSTVNHTSTLSTADGCDSVIVTTVNVNPTYNLNETASVCPGGSHTFPDGTTQNNITSTVNHTSTLSTAAGCDSIIVTTVNVNPEYNINNTVDLCSGMNFTFPDGTTQNNITSNTSHTSNLTTVAGCDSIVTININVVSTYQTNVTAQICTGDSYTFPDGTTQNNITANVTQIDTLNSAGGCDSVVTTTVNVNPLYNETETVSVCSGASHTFPDGTVQNNITTTTTHTSNLNSEFGCDSVVVTTVNVDPVYNETETVSICPGGSHTFPDGTTQNNITSTVNYTSTLNSADGCDSVIVTTVNLHPEYNINNTVDLCSGMNFTFPDGTTQNNITSNTSHTSNLTTVAGCDSIVIININVVSTYQTSVNADICSGDSYTFPDGTTQDNITANVTQIDTLNSLGGCDSVITTTVNVNPNYTQSVTAEVCSGDSYTFPDGTTVDNITATIVRSDTLESVNTCDSIITTTVNVTVVDVSVVQNQATLTAGATNATYQWINCSDNSAISGATEQAFVATSDGSYAVIITQSQCTDTSTCYNVTGVGIADNRIPDAIRVYPNPTEGKINIEGIDAKKETIVKIWNSNGDIVFSEKAKKASFIINLGEEPRGTYLIQIINDKLFLSEKVVLL